MEEIFHLFILQFYNDIQKESIRLYNDDNESLQCDLQLRNDIEILDFIKVYRLELMEYLEESDLKTSFPKIGIEKDLNGCLNKYFHLTQLDLPLRLEFSKSVKLREYRIDFDRSTLILNPLEVTQSRYQCFDFSNLTIFQEIPQYVSSCWMFIELNRLDKENKERIDKDERKQHFTSSASHGQVENPEIALDYSNNVNSERIVFLSELGILDYLQNKMNVKLHGCSVNKLAEVVSKFTGVPQSTVQSYLNPMFSKGVDQNNNPATPKNINKVKNKLKDIGF